MDYTKNYHLPQWVEDDRILRTDFNDAMANIETGINSTATITKKLWYATNRCARRILASELDRCDKNAISKFNGILCAPICTRELAGLSEGARWSDKLGVYAGRGEELTNVDLKNSRIGFRGGILSLAASSINAHSYYEFTAPVNGVIRGFTLFTKLTSVATGGDPHLNRPIHFTAKKKVGTSYSELVYEKDLTLDKIFTKEAAYEDEIEVEIPIVKGEKYYLELRISGSTDVRGHFGFVSEGTDNASSTSASWTDHSRFHVYGEPVLSAALVQTLKTEGTFTRAVAIARYRKYGDSPKASFQVNNVPLAEQGCYDRTDKDGAAYVESWHTYETPYYTSGEVAIKAILTSDGADDARMIEYGVFLI